MLSDIVWNDAYERAKRVAEEQELTLVDILLQSVEDRPSRHWRMEAQASRSDRLGCGEEAMEEEGEITLYLCTRIGELSTPDALELCTAMSAAFRIQIAGVSTWPDGLYYDGQSLFPPDPDTTGNWISIGLTIRYRYQNRIEPPA